MEQNGLYVFLLGFVSDHVEILYDNDIICRNIVENAGATYGTSAYAQWKYPIYGGHGKGYTRKD